MSDARKRRIGWVAKVLAIAVLIVLCERTYYFISWNLAASWTAQTYGRQIGQMRLLATELGFPTAGNLEMREVSLDSLRNAYSRHESDHRLYGIVPAHECADTDDQCRSLRVLAVASYSFPDSLRPPFYLSEDLCDLMYRSVRPVLLNDGSIRRVHEYVCSPSSP